MEFGLQGTGSIVGSHLKNKEEYWPSKAEQRLTSPPWIPFPLWAAVCRPPVLHLTTFKIAFVKGTHSGHFHVCACLQQ